jgi:aryl-alcohol dehydrogenase-like predicted oxidoreductase
MPHSKERRIMQKRKIGTLEVSVVGLGCNNFGWKLDADATARVVDAALASGINFFDTADIYGKTQSEQFLGKALGSRRSQVVLATKFGMKVDEQRQGAKPSYVHQAAEDSLQRLGMDHIDLYQLHQPDPNTPIADTLAAMDKLVKAGKVRQIGCSNFSAEQLRAAQAAVQQGAARFVSVQNEFNLLHRDPQQSGVLDECQRLDIAFIPFFPLASGMLTGKYRKNKPLPEGTRIQPGGRFDKLLTEETLDKVEALIAWAEKHGHTLLELAFSWLAAQPTVASVIAGATTPDQVKSNAAAVNWNLTEKDLREIDRILG